MNDSLFSGETPPVIDEQKDYESELVGEGKKFKTTKDLARGKYEADLFIETLKKQQDDLREEYLKLREESVKRDTVEDLLAKFEEKRQSNIETPVTEKSEIDYNKIESLIDSRVEQRETSRKQTENFNLVKSRLEQEYGDRYQSVLKQKINELGSTTEFIDTLARTNPRAALKMLDLVEVEPRQDPYRAHPRTQQNSAFKPVSKKRTWSYYQDMKATDPKKYFDPKTTIQMTQDYAELGSEFEDGNFRQYDNPGYLKFNS